MVDPFTVLTGKIVQLRDGLRIAVHLDLVFQRSNLGGPRGKNQVLRAERIHDVVGGKSVGLKSREVQIDLDLAYFAAIGVRGRGTGHSRELRAQEVVSEIEKLLLGQRLAAQAQLDDRCRGGGIGDDQRRHGSRWQAPEDGLRHRRGLRQRRLDVRRGLKKYLNHPNAIERLRLDVFNVINGDRQTALGVGDDAVGHFVRGHPSIVPHHANHGDVDVRQDVNRHSHNHQRRQKDQHQRHDGKRIRASKG